MPEYREYMFYGPRPRVEEAVAGLVNVIGPIEVDRMRGASLGLRLGGLSVVVALAQAKCFARVRTYDEMPPVPPGCFVCEVEDADKVTGVFA